MAMPRRFTPYEVAIVVEATTHPMRISFPRLDQRLHILVGLRAWLVRLSVAVADSGGSTVELELSASITSPLQLAIVQELKEKLFGYSSKGCNIIESGAGTGIVSIVLAGLRSAFFQSPGCYPGIFTHPRALVT